MFEINKDNVGDVFRYHKPTEAQLPKYTAVNTACLEAAAAILNTVPRSPLRTRALNAIFDARMLANAAIATEQIN